MDMMLKAKFLNLWEEYFDGAALPVVFYYTDNGQAAGRVKTPVGHRCVIADLARVAAGRNLLFDFYSLGCFGGRHYLGFAQNWAPDFEHFLSTGLPGTVEGERYKKTPELVKTYMDSLPAFKAPARYIVFKRWDRLVDGDTPEVVIFFDTPDVLSGLFTLANYDQSGVDGVFSPFGAGCATIVQYPYFEKDADTPRGVLGMLDVSARPCVRPGVLTFAVPMEKFTAMVENMQESFLSTESWSKVRKRIATERKRRP
ncbi:MAG: DUF169 domain-containing protein [Syntrophobacterales bacterium]|jgi:uncharacterized protein (DUF169 family)|nr:DUF169 domain-containing protein [Syntrophobacterales bacterium]